MIRRAALVVLAALAALAAGATPARAHAVLASSDPADGAQLERAPSAVTVRFTEPVDRKLSSVGVVDTTGRALATGPLEDVSGDGLRVTLSEVPEGVYTVTWRVVSRVDGHVTGGAFAFGVGVSPAGVDLPDSEVTLAPSPSVLSVAGRALFYAGLLALLGLAVASRRFLAGSPPGFARASWVAWGASLAGLVALAESQRATAGAGWSEFFGTSLGHAVGWRALPLAIAGIALGLARGNAGAPMVGVATAATMFAHAASGHAATGDFRWGKVAIQALHMVAIGVWLGGLGALLGGMRGLDADTRASAVRRYSAAALYAFVVVAVTGILRAVNEIDSFSSLRSTTFGRVVLAKLGILIALGAMGAVNRFRHVPVAGSDTRGLRRVGGAEIGIAAVVLALTGILAGVAPSRTLVATQNEAGARALVAEGSDFGTTVRARLEAAPGRPGPNAFAVTVADYDSGDPVEASRVALRFAFGGEAAIESSTLELERTQPGRYEGRGSNLSVAGAWGIEVIVQTAASSVVVPLKVEVASGAQQQVRVIPGDPTLYDITMPGGRAVQMYVDPGRAGDAEVHATFFNPAGGEEAGLTGIVLTATGPDGTTRRLEARILSPGHFVSDLRTIPGRWRFDVEARTADGERLFAFFEHEIDP